MPTFQQVGAIGRYDWGSWHRYERNKKLRTGLLALLGAIGRYDRVDQVFTGPSHFAVLLPSPRRAPRQCLAAAATVKVPSSIDCDVGRGERINRGSPVDMLRWITARF